MISVGAFGFLKSLVGWLAGLATGWLVEQDGVWLGFTDFFFFFFLSLNRAQ